MNSVHPLSHGRALTIDEEESREGRDVILSCIGQSPRSDRGVKPGYNNHKYVGRYEGNTRNYDD